MTAIQPDLFGEYDAAQDQALNAERERLREIIRFSWFLGSRPDESQVIFNDRLAHELGLDPDQIRADAAAEHHACEPHWHRGCYRRRWEHT